MQKVPLRRELKMKQSLKYIINDFKNAASYKLYDIIIWVFPNFFEYAI